MLASFPGLATQSRLMKRGGAPGVQILSNIFIDCGQEFGTDGLDDVGWYGVTGAVTFIGSNNFVSGPSPAWLPKTSWPESGDFNGVDPWLVDVDDPLGLDDLPFTADDGLRPDDGSLLVDTGYGGTDIGAYSATASQTVPTAPSGLAVNTVSANAIALTWSDNSNNEDQFEIQRSPDQAAWVTVATVTANTTGWTNNGLTPSTLYYYRVRATSTFGNSTFSNISGTTTGSSAPNKRQRPRVDPFDIAQ